MLRITRLHVLIAGIGVISLIFGLWKEWGLHQELRAPRVSVPTRSLPAVQKRPVVSINQKEVMAMSQLRKNAVQSVATIGEAYQPLRRQYGDIPPIVTPLRSAKTYLAQGKYDLAMASARQSWKALKTFRTKIGSIPVAYQVMRGDTLWRIAEMHSPAHSGAGWVTLWRANQSMVTNFNRIEVGMMLKIPQHRSQYITPFWRPRTP